MGHVCGSKLIRRGYAGFGPRFHLPGFHFGTGVLSHSHIASCTHCSTPPSKATPEIFQESKFWGLSPGEGLDFILDLTPERPPNSTPHPTGKPCFTSVWSLSPVFRFFCANWSRSGRGIGSAWDGTPLLCVSKPSILGRPTPQNPPPPRAMDLVST